MRSRPVIAAAAVLAALSLSVPAFAADDAPAADGADDAAWTVDQLPDDAADAADDLGDCADVAVDPAIADDGSDVPDPTADDSADVRAADDAVDDATDDPGSDDPTADDGADVEDDSWYCDAEDPSDDVLSGDEDVRLSLRALLTGGAFDPGAVVMPGAGTVTERLTMARPHRGAAARAAKAPSRVVLATVTRTVRRSGAVHVKLRVTKTGRAALRRAGRRPALSLTVRLAPKGKAAHVGTHRVKLK